MKGRVKGKAQAQRETCTICHSVTSPAMIPHEGDYVRIYAERVTAKLKLAMHFANVSWGISDVQWLKNQIDTISCRMNEGNFHANDKFSSRMIFWLQGLEQTAISYFPEKVER